jgi:hypothetical protein
VHPSSSTLTALLSLILPTSALPISAAAPIASNNMATGDVWPSWEELVYVPREALELPDPFFTERS